MQLLVALEVARGKEEGTLEYCRVLHASWFVIILWTKFGASTGGVSIIGANQPS